MNSGVGVPPQSPANRTVIDRTVIDARLKQLRRERRLIEKAMQALSELSRTRESHARRALTRR